MIKPIRVLIVDDSAFMRLVVTRHLQRDPKIVVVGGARDGIEALRLIAELRPDVVTLDIEMPFMDGLTTLQRIMDEHPTPVVMLSSSTQQGAQNTITALLRGAVDFVAKPDGETTTEAVMEELVSKVKVAASAHHVARIPQLHTEPKTSQITRISSRASMHDPLIIIGSSTGGPRALNQVFATLPADLPAAILLVQHMPAGFTQSLAQRLDESYPFCVREAHENDHLERGVALLAPGDYHLRLDEHLLVRLDRGAMRNHVRPSVDVTMESAVEHYPGPLIGVILTGIGSDGTSGAAKIRNVGGKVIAEHESTSVVYGMPRSVVEAGAADFVVGLPNIGGTLQALVHKLTQ
jgi:two-component system chemotaxis response regulator CheB